MGPVREVNSRHHVDDDDSVDEESKLLRTIPPGISARSYSISGTHSVILEQPGVYKSRWRSIRVMYLTMFLSSVSFSICMSSLYPYLKILDQKANTDYLGWVVAAYSVGQLVASPFFGAWSLYRSRTREPIIVSLIVNVLANVLYMYLESIPYNAKVYLLIARVFIGFGAGNVAVVRSYVSGATTIPERTSAMANMSACQAIGFIIGPLIQTAMVPIGFPGPARYPELHFDMYTATAFFSALVGILNIVLLIVVFKEHTVNEDLTTASNIQAAVQEPSLDFTDIKPDYWAIIPSIGLFFSVLFIFAVFETIATPLSMHMFAWEKSEATLYVGVILGAAGFVSIAVFAVIKVLSKRFNERYLLFGGFIFCLLGFVVYLPWGHDYPEIQYAELDVPETLVNNTVINNTNSELFLFKQQYTDSTQGFLSQKLPLEPIYSSDVMLKQTVTGVLRNVVPNAYNVANKNTSNSLTANLNSYGVKIGMLGDSTLPPARDSNFSNHEAVGCPYYYDWCMTTPELFLWQFLVGTFFIAVGYPTCNVMSYAIYSKILGPKPQGIWMGWLTAAGSLARTLGPVFVSQVYDAFGPRVTFVSLIVVIILSIIGFIAVFRRLVPYRTNRSILVQEP